MKCDKDATTCIEKVNKTALVRIDPDPIFTFSQAGKILNEYSEVKGWSSNAVTQEL